MNIKMVFGLLCILFFGLFLFFARQSKYKEYHSANINGTIDTFYRYRDYVMLHVNSVEFRIIPISYNSSLRFDDVAKIGDTVIKSTNNDTLHLIDQQGKFLYTVGKW